MMATSQLAEIQEFQTRHAAQWDVTQYLISLTATLESADVSKAKNIADSGTTYKVVNCMLNGHVL